VSDLPNRHNIKENYETFESIAENLDANCFLTVPVYYRKQVIGRVLIFSRRRRLFELSDIDFLLQVINQFMPIVENIRLIDHLASSAAEEERKKIARDIHDSIIQPYIGLQMGIDSVINVLEKNSLSHEDNFKAVDIIKTRINRLRDLTEKGIVDLRAYIKNLSLGKNLEMNLLPAIKSYAQKFENATGISIQINAADNIQINDGLAAELFQIVAEGLSNVRRHTHSPSALVDIAADKDKLTLAIENVITDNVYKNFYPRSISERAKSLGGSLEIQQEDTRTIVRVEIPL
jgi:signal transduction histidine kinase